LSRFRVLQAYPAVESRIKIESTVREAKHGIRQPEPHTVESAYANAEHKQD